MPKIKIGDAITGKVIISCQASSLGEAVKTAVKMRRRLDYANLYGVELPKANLKGVSFYGACFINADLKRANLSRAFLAHANLTNADLRGANLEGVYLENANISYTDLIDGGHDVRGYRFWAWQHTDGHVVYRAGCREWSDFSEALKHYGKSYDGNGNKADCITRMHLLHICAASRGWIKLKRWKG